MNELCGCPAPKSSKTCIRPKGHEGMHAATPEALRVLEYIRLYPTIEAAHKAFELLWDQS